LENAYSGECFDLKDVFTVAIFNSMVLCWLEEIESRRVFGKDLYNMLALGMERD